MATQGRRSKAEVPRRPRLRAARDSYHHGDLRRVLVEQALRLAAEGGIDAVNIREAARRAGVSPGAPFRHFADRQALIVAVAEEAQRRFRSEVDRAVAAAPQGDPLARFRAIGVAYLRWALRNPMHFEVISSGRVFDHDQSGALSRDNNEIIAMVDRALADAAAQGQLGAADVEQVRIAGRALVYGFARMAIDGHFNRWRIAKQDVESTGEAMLEFFTARISSA
jgi:AcrR family transcriptional regulator